MIYKEVICLIYDKEGCSGKLGYDVAKEMGLLEPIKNLCKLTWKEGLVKGLHSPIDWTYAGMLDYLGREMEGKDSGKAGPLMFKNAKEMNLIEPIKAMKKEAWERGLKIGCHERYDWTLNGMLKYLGIKIAIIENTKIPK